MKSFKDVADIPSRKTIEPNPPQDRSVQIKMIRDLANNKFLSRKNKIKTLLSMKRKDEDQEWED